MYIIMTCFQNISTTKQTHQILKILKVTSLTIPPISSYPTTCPLLASFPGISTVPQLQDPEFSMLCWYSGWIYLR